ncbi:hypothetical protein O7623_15650 [Solwaraspora sp. WMMD791]|uniref:hypothetical protein n=1 Tax=Solwaraspora sp. WMMD791 TaxID=3016086 RepID=UPI00249BEE55|nr:hypothetical protein [Solwaraspora sp. WMMD791]WFE24871.1 hypothetical protein O7623_15650 [Solwaraspora sp. WMMD791]
MARPRTVIVKVKMTAQHAVRRGRLAGANIAASYGAAHLATDWIFTAVGFRPSVQLGLVPGTAVPLDTAAPELIRR